MAWIILAGALTLLASPAPLAGSDAEPATDSTSAAPSAPVSPATGPTVEGEGPVSTSAPPAAAAATGDPTRPSTAATEPTTPAPPEEPPSSPKTYPRLVLALGPMVGPHAIGNDQCLSEEARCEKKGSFFGAGGNLEVRVRLYRPLYLHGRGIAVRNVSPNDPIYSGLVGGGVGLGAYGRRIFGRAEYLGVWALGDNRFEPPFFEGAVARDDWGHHAGMVSVGFRQPLPHGLAVELWGGPMFGPRSVRLVPQTEPDERVLTTFMLGLNLSWDAWK